MKYFIPLYLLIFFAISCGDNNNKSTAQYDTPTIATDKDYYRIIPYTKADSFIVRNAEPIELSDLDLTVLYTILQQAVNDYNLEIREEIDEQKAQGEEVPDAIQKELISLDKYKRQYMPVKSEGHRIVYVNCLCKIPENEDWSAHIIDVLDGGTCYFSVFIDLDTKDYSAFFVNGQV